MGSKSRYSVSYTMTAVEEGWREVEANSTTDAEKIVRQTLLDNPGDFMPSGEAEIEINDIRKVSER